jgi:hypothetical protein
MPMAVKFSNGLKKRIPLTSDCALVNDLILVTHNTQEFSRVASLKIEDWE